MPSTIISISHRKQFVPTYASGTFKRKQPLVMALRDLLESVASGAISPDGVSVQLGTTANVPATRACASLALSSGTGAVGATINGVAITVTWATSDAASMTAFCAAVRASSTAKVKGVVSAVNRRAQLTLVSCAAGTAINVGGIRFTAVNGAAAVLNPYQFDMSGTDTQDAAALVAAINAAPGCGERFRATNNAGVVSIFLMEDRAATSQEIIAVESGSGATVNQQITQDAHGLVFAIQPGVVGNCMAAAASGTGASLFTVTAGYLGAGSGGDSSNVADVAPL